VLKGFVAQIELDLSNLTHKEFKKSLAKGYNEDKHLLAFIERQEEAEASAAAAAPV
jgi:hypothetical protein